MDKGNEFITSYMELPHVKYYFARIRTFAFLDKLLGCTYVRRLPKLKIKDWIIEK